MPETLLHPFLVMMPRLLAEEQLELVNALTATGGLQIKEKDFHQFVEGLERRTAGLSPVERRAPKVRSVDALARFGGEFMRVRRVEKVASAITTTRPGERPGLRKRKEVKQDG